MLLPGNPRALINSLSIGQIDSLIQEEKFKRIGYKFNYLCDAHDIKLYCHPLGLYGKRQQDSNLPLEYITDEQIALFNLFQSPAFQAVISIAHKEEIEAYVDTINLLKKQGDSIINTSRFLSDKLKEKYENLKEFAMDINKVRSNISLILTIAVGLAAEGIKKLDELVKAHKILLYENRLDEMISGDVIEEAFAAAYKTELTDELFAFMIKHSSRLLKTELEGSESETDNWKIFKMRIAIHRDSLAIDRVLRVNKFLKTNDKKIIFLYLSSDTKTAELFYQNDRLSPYLPVIETEQFICQRNTAQLFLKMLCEDEVADKTLENLEKFKTVLEEARSAKIRSSDRTKTNEFASQIEMKIEFYRKKYADFATVARIDEFKKLTATVKEDDEDFFVIESLKNLIKNKEKHLLHWNIEADNSLQSIQQLIVLKPQLIDLIDNIIINTNTHFLKRLDAGNDFIIGTDHHMPTVFDLTDEHCKPSFHDFVSHYQDTEEQLKAFVTKDAMALFEIRQNAEEELMLKRCLLLLMLSDSEDKRDENAGHCIFFLENFRWSKQLLNAWYLLSWVYRRRVNYERAIVTAKRSLAKFKADARFHHGIALTLYCLYQENVKTDDCLEESIKEVDIALKQYSKADKEDPNYKIIMHNIYALLNTKIYLYCLLFEESRLKDDQTLDDARDLLRHLKNKIKGDINLTYYYTKPEFLHTEAYLELLEFKHSGKKEKLKHALTAVESALAQASNLKLYGLCSSLRDDISSIIASADAKKLS